MKYLYGVDELSGGRILNSNQYLLNLVTDLMEYYRRSCLFCLDQWMIKNLIPVHSITLLQLQTSLNEVSCVLAYSAIVGK